MPKKKQTKQEAPKPVDVAELQKQLVGRTITKANYKEDVLLMRLDFDDNTALFIHTGGFLTAKVKPMEAENGKK